MKQVLVTGATGFIGTRLIEALLTQDVALRVLTRDVTKAQALWPNNAISYYRIDFERPADLGECCRGVDTVFHLAGYAHAEDEGTPDAEARHWAVTAHGTRLLTQAVVAAGVSSLVFLSSVKAMGENTSGCIDETSPVEPTTMYGKAKRQAEEYVMSAATQSGMRAVVLRLPLVYGPGSKGNLWRFISAVDRRRYPPIPDVNNRRSMVHVDDVVQALLRASTNSASGSQIYIVTDGHAYSTRQIYELVCAAVGRAVPRWNVPMSALRLTAKLGDAISRMRGRRFVFDTPTLEKLYGTACYNSAKISHQLGYRPTCTLKDGLQQMVAEYRARRLHIP